MTHVDHVRPFQALAMQFIDMNGGSWPSIRETPDVLYRKTLTDPTFEKEWESYHAQHAQLQLLCATCNLKKGCKIF